MEELTPLEKQYEVNDLIGEWLESTNLYLLAKEGELVYWTSITGLPEDYKWHKMTVIEASRIAKVMLVPPQYMMYCTSDAVYTAAQERGRAYMEGVRSSKKVLPTYFNFTEHEKSVLCPNYTLVHSTLVEFWVKGWSPEWKDIKGVLLNLYLELELEQLSDTAINRHIRTAATDLGYKICHGKSRYYWRPVGGIYKKYTCLRYPNTVGVSDISDLNLYEVERTILEKHKCSQNLN